MKKRTIVSFISILILTGCQQFKDSYDGVTKTMSEFSLDKTLNIKSESQEEVKTKTTNDLDDKKFQKTSLREICIDLNKNKYSAVDKWDKKYIEFSSKVAMVSKSAPMFNGDPFFKYPETILSFKTGVHITGSENCVVVAYLNLDQIKKINAGDTVKIKGQVGIPSIPRVSAEVAGRELQAEIVVSPSEIIK
ncbi:hypothetical protein HA49_01985 [Tatumella morbirosei]|uniref:Lipoprotein n=1 Tax=Tatumella morbirosei TaxID=642227 RepID=A0A095TS24_9GAMM|nr:hypothetical protein [Tatumella morbirosei]KGD79379.1 hypothetical protein HA49_01985 [Tatumella morbirosei]